MPEKEPLRLAIIGSQTLNGNPLARAVIERILERDQPQLVVSGGAIGIDRMAAAQARKRGIPVVEHMPEGTGWQYYRKRNLKIVASCNYLVRLADPMSSSYGSGWTCDRARKQGIPTEEWIIRKGSFTFLPKQNTRA